VTGNNARLIRLRIEILVDPDRTWPDGGPVRGACGMWEELLDETDACQEYRILAADTVSGPGLALWRDQESLTEGNPAHWSTRAQGGVVTPEMAARALAYPGFPGAIVVAEDEPEGPCVRLAFLDEARDATLAERDAIMARGVASGRYPAPVYSDRACGMCRNALTVGEARDNGRYCDVCARERQHLMSGIQYLDDGTGSMVDPGSASVIELSGIYDDCTGQCATIKRIHVNTPARGKGVASVLLDAVCGDADSGDVNLRLEVAAREGEGGLDNDQLAAWYARHGFVADTDRNPPGRWLIRPCAKWRTGARA
jgi:GNAT superfamily N-acetyltransferase